MDAVEIIRLVFEFFLVPLAGFAWSANARLATLATKVDQLESRLNGGNGVPVRCARHEERLADVEDELDRLKGCA